MYIGNNKWEGDDSTTLSSLDMNNGNEQPYRVTIRFFRALAFLSQQELGEMVNQVERRTQGKYPYELIIQGINMAPECKIEQTMSNLVNNAVTVFESIL